MSGQVIDASRRVLGHQVINVAGVASPLTVPAENGIPATAALFMSRNADSYWRADASVVTVVNGFPLPRDRELFYAGDLSKLRFIGDASAELRVVYFV